MLPRERQQNAAGRANSLSWCARALVRMNAKQASKVMIPALAALIAAPCGSSFAQTGRTSPSAEVRCDKDWRKESICLAALGGLVRRSGALLTIRLENGKTTTIGDPDRCKSCVEYRLLGYLPARHAIVLSAQFWEWRNYALLDRRSGNLAHLDGEPHFSPDGKRFVVATRVNEMLPDTNEHLLAVYAASDPPKLEWSYTGEFSVFKFKSWDGNHRINLVVGKWTDADGDPGRNSVLLRTGEGWRLVTR